MEALKEIYGDKIIEYPVLRYTSQGCNYPINHPEVHQRPNPGYMRGEEVLIESLLLGSILFEPNNLQFKFVKKKFFVGFRIKLLILSFNAVILSNFGYKSLQEIEDFFINSS